MPELFKKTFQQIRDESIRALEDGGVITNVSTTGVARQLIDVANQQLAEFFDAIEFHNRMTQLNTAVGLFLDLIGQGRGITRNEAQTASVTAEDRVIRFYATDGATPLTTLLGSGQIPSNTLIQSSDGLVVFSTTRTVNVDTSQTEIFVPAVATSTGSGHNVGPNVLIEHDLGVGTVGVTNDVAIVSGDDTESDSNYRFRISRALDRAAGATEQAIRLAAFSFPEIADIQFRPFADGVGSYEALLIPVGNTVAPDTVLAIRTILQSVSAFGNKVLVRTPDLLPVELVVQLSFRSEATNVERNQIRTEVRRAVLGYIEELEIGQTFVLNELVQRVMETNTLIMDMRVLVYRFRGEAHVLRNVKAEADELFVPDPSSPNAVKVI